MDKAKIGLIGIGRIGRIHLRNLREEIAGAEVIAAVSPSESSQQYCRDLGIAKVSSDPNLIFSDPEIDGVVICSSTATHAEFIEQGVFAGKYVFCEKPVDLSLARVQEVLHRIGKGADRVMMGFNQRFDLDFSQVKRMITDGGIGDLRMIKITSRDPSPPPISYIESSGGLFHDMTIHDFDMARFLANSEVIEIYASGSNLVDPAIGRAGDIDTAVVLLTFENGCQALIENSREACYGYDQRLEVLGSGGMIQAGNQSSDHVLILDGDGVHGSRLKDFFMDRYAESYRLEMEAFVRSILDKTIPPVTVHDGLKASAIAEAANKSMELNRPVKMTEIS